MNKQTLVVIVGALVLLAIGVVGAVAFTGGGGTPVMTMPDGSTMPADQMTTDATTDHSMMGSTGMP